MFDINTKNVKKGKNFFYIFLFFGIISLFSIVGIIILNVTRINSLDSQIMSKRVEIKSYINDEGTKMYSPIYYYEIDGKIYECGSNYSSSSNPGTENKTVYYDSQNPDICMTDHVKTVNYVLLFFLIIPIVFITVAIKNIKKINQRIKKIMELNQIGKLVKKLPYRLENTGMVINNVPVKRPVVDYILPTGETITLYGDARHDKKHFDADGMVDLLIDESNPNNYYIDFEINRLAGNSPQDYYQRNNQVNEPNLYNEQSSYDETNQNNMW